jgi:hypothetical protein
MLARVLRGRYGFNDVGANAEATTCAFEEDVRWLRAIK